MAPLKSSDHLIAMSLFFWYSDFIFPQIINRNRVRDIKWNRQQNRTASCLTILWGFCFFLSYSIWFYFISFHFTLWCLHLLYSIHCILGIFIEYLVCARYDSVWLGMHQWTKQSKIAALLKLRAQKRSHK